MNEVAVALASVLLTGGLVTAIVTAFKARSERRKTEAEAHAVGVKTPAEVESISILTMTNALNGARAINDDYKKQLEGVRTELGELKQQQDADRTALREELEDTRRQLDSVRRGLAAAHQYVTILLAWIEEHLPGVKPPGPPTGYTNNR